MKNGWKTKTLGDVANVTAGNSAPQAESSFKDGTYPFFRTSDAGRIRFGDIYESTDYLNEDGVKGLRIFPKGTILFPKSGASTFLNHRVMLGVEGCVSSHLAAIVADETQVNRRFLLNYLATISAQDLVQDHAYPSLNLPAIAAISIKVPPLSEQLRIVQILDDAFDGIATAKVATERNLQNVRALFDSYLDSVLTKRGKGWVETTLGAEVDLLTGFPFKSSQYTDSDGSVRLLRGDNIVQGSLRWDDVKKWPASDIAQYKRFQLLAGDVVLAMDRPWVKAGLKRARITSNDLPCLLVQRTARLRAVGQVDNRFLAHLIGSNGFIRHILGVQTGIGVPHISSQQIRDFQFFRPSAKEQIFISDLLDELLSESQRLESIYRRKVARLEVLKNGLLHQAFSGRL